MSTFLQENLGALHELEEFNKSYPLIDSSPPKWERIIRGDIEANNFPAKRFFEEAGLASEKGMVVIQNHDSLNNTKLKVNYLNNENFISLKNKIEELNKLFNEITPYVDPNQ